MGRAFTTHAKDSLRPPRFTGAERGLLVLILLAAFWFPGCEALTGSPHAGDPVGTTVHPPAPFPLGNSLFCITNLGHTLTLFHLDTATVPADAQRYLEPDPVGPWFERAQGGPGYYLSRVESSGQGRNALIRFDSATGGETGRLYFAANSNPNDVLLLPGLPDTAWVALRGSTFDNFATNGIALVDLPSMTQTAFFDLNELALLPGTTLTSLLGFQWDPGCLNGAGCAYAVVNNWYNAVRPGWLLVLAVEASGAPRRLDYALLGANPLLPLLVETATGELWVVNNGGYSTFCANPETCDGGPGTLQVLSRAALTDGIPGNGTVALLAAPGGCAGSIAPCTEYTDFPPDPVGIYRFSPTRAWVTTWPDDIVREVSLESAAPDFRALLPANRALPRLTGPLIAATAPAPALFSGKGGFGPAQLGHLNPLTGALSASYDLKAGNGPVSCAEHAVP